MAEKYTFDIDGAGYEYEPESPMTREQAQAQVRAQLDAARVKADRPEYPRDIGGEYDELFPEVQPEVAKAPPIPWEEMTPAQQAYEAQRRKAEDSTVFDQVLGGVRGSGRRLREGVQQIWPGGEDPSEEEMAATRGMESTPAGAVGGMAGDIATYFVPGMGVEAGLTWIGTKLPAAMGALRALRGARATRPVPAGPLKESLRSLAPATITGGAEMGLQPVMEGESRLGNIAMGGGLSALPGAVMRAGRFAAGPMEAGPSAQKMFDAGYDMSLGQATQGSPMGTAINFMEELSESVPLAGARTKRNRAILGNQVIEETSRRAFPEGPPPGLLPGRGKYLDEGEAQFNRAYPEIIGDKNLPMNMVELGTLRGAATKIAQEADVAPSDLKRLRRDLGKYTKLDMTGDEWKRADSHFRDRKNAFWDKYTSSKDLRDMEMIRAYESARESLTKVRDRNFTPDEVKALGDLDKQYAIFKLLERTAAQGDLGEGQTILARNLVNEVQQGTPDALLARSKGRLQDITDPTADLIKQELGDNPFQRRHGMQLGLGALTAFLTAAGGASGLTLPAAIMGIPNATSGPRVARAMTGQGARQKAVAEALRKANDNLYKFPVMGGVGFMGAQELED